MENQFSRLFRPRECVEQIPLAPEQDADVEGAIMQSEGVRIRISFTTREIELSGNNKEVVEWWDRLEVVLGQFARPSDKSPKIARGAEDGNGEQDVPESFGEYFNDFPAEITDVDRMLAAACFVQLHDPDKCFTTSEASKLLAEHGIKVGNPSQCVKQNVDKRHVFAHNGKYRVSKPGIDHLTELKTPVR